MQREVSLAASRTDPPPNLPPGWQIVERLVTPSAVFRSWHEDAPRTRGLGRAMHRDLEIAWAARGGLAYRVGTHTFELRAASAIVVPPGVEHVTLAVPGPEAFSVHLKPELVAEVADAFGPAYRRHRIVTGTIDDAGRLIRIANLLGEEAAGPGPAATLAAEAFTEALAVELIRGAPSERCAALGHDPRIRHALQCIEERSTEPLTLDDLARAAGMSRFHFSRLFRQALGRSPYRYLLDVRLARAAERLRAGHATVTEAALDAGFTDLSRFARLFRRRFGCRPSEMAGARSAQRIPRSA
jgi:AraC family transcriptional regulator